MDAWFKQLVINYENSEVDCSFDESKWGQKNRYGTQQDIKL